MTRLYIDTSAALKLVLDEPESAALVAHLDRQRPELLACWLLETELRRAAVREPALTQTAVSDLLAGVALHGVPASLFREAGLLPGPHLRSLDALHLAAAVRLGVDHVLTYDARMGSAARAIGLAVLAPA